MRYFFVEPEVARCLGDRTILDRSVHPPIVSQLHYQLEGWLGDEVIESFPAFVVTEAAKESLQRVGATGAAFDEVEITVTDQFEALYPGRELPLFVRLRPKGKAGQDDIGTAADGRLVLSQRALDSLSGLGMSNALIEPFEA